MIDLLTATGTVFKEAMPTGRIIVNHNRDLMGRILIRLLSEEEDFQKRKRALAAEVPPRSGKGFSVSKEVRSQKLDSIARCLQRIETHMPASAKDLAQDVDCQDILILNLERLIQTSVDCASVLIADRNWVPMPDSMALAFAVLATKKVIPDALADRLAKAVGFRNLCVHEYDKINWEIVYAIVTRHLDEFRQFAGTIDREP